jgi:pilus assembly protein Flp/PilA
MRFYIRLVIARLLNVASKEDGQDLIEYALMVALIALAVTAGMHSLATAINNGFSTLGTTLTSSL